MITLDDILGPHLAGYEPRPPQKQMAEAVQNILQTSGSLVIEAGTGTGKSLAYLLPLVEFSLAEEKRAVVSTYTKALQRQLVEKDLPFLKKNVFEDMRFALCLGSENYLCLRRLEQANVHGLFDEDNERERLIKWAETTRTGIRQGTGGALWYKVSRESDICYGKDCRHFRDCFYQRAKERERRSHILVVNHHLFFANLATGLRALPEFDLAVFDEAHELEDIAADYMGLEVSNFGVRYILNNILGQRGRGLLGRLKWLGQSDIEDAAAPVHSARMQADLLFSELGLLFEKPTLRIKERHVIEEGLSEHLMRLGRKLDALKDKAPEDDKKELDAMASRCMGTAAALRTILGQELSEDDHVYWAERSGTRLRMVATPVDVAGLQVFGDLQAAVFTSATLTTGGGFQYIKGRLGLESAEEVLLETHFNYKEQAVLYIAHDLPEPNTPDFEEKAIERIREILKTTGGGTLVLFTSYSMLNRAFEAIDVEGLRILRQGDDDSYKLVEQLRNDRRTAIFGTYTFWQGIDVPGDALECVVITKLPFAVPDEPVIEARTEKLKKEGKDPFVLYQVPQAALLLRQGFGRLIRTSTDRGVVAVLDSRISAKWYGKLFLGSLPECRITGNKEDIADFLIKEGV
jgi:ATP-dependent DNA helicase DinG